MRALLEQILGDLKGRKNFRLRGRALNREYDELDVFAGVDDASLAAFSPTDEGEAEAFVLWSRAAEAAFSGDGALTRPLPIVWGGSRNELQLAFARHGLTIRIEVDATPREGYDESGTLVLSPRSGRESCDLRRLLAAFTELEARGVIALARAGMTQSSGWESVGERERDEQQTAVFWHDQSHDGFDALGQIGSQLHLYWRGDEGLVAEVLTRAGLSVERPSSPQVAIVVAGRGAAPPAIETYAEALAANPPPTSRRARKSRAPAGPFAELHRHRAPGGPKPVQRLMFDRGGEGLVVAQVSDRRGGPTHALCRIEAATGAVTRIFAPLSTVAATCGGCAFLADGRLVFSFYDFLPDPRPGYATSAARVLVWEPGGDAVHELGAHPISHVCNVSLSSVDAAGEHVAVVTATGVAILAVGPPGAKAWRELARIGGDAVDAYPIAALSPDGRHVAWTADGAEETRCVERAGGRVAWKVNFFPGHRGGRATRALLFDPRGEHLLALCLRSLYGPERDGKIEVEEERRLQCYAVSDGRRALAELEAATLGLTCLAWHPDGKRLAIGTAAGEVALLAYPGGERLASQRAFAKGSVTAVTFDRAGARVAAGSEKGEIAVLAVDAAGG
jgi:hypothetical protein